MVGRTIRVTTTSVVGSCLELILLMGRLLRGREVTSTEVREEVLEESSLRVPDPKDSVFKL